MVIALLANDNVKEEIISKGVPANIELIWVDSLRSLRMIEADAYFDLQFEYDPERISKLRFLFPRLVFINSVIHTCSETDENFVRINAWPTMMSRNLIEIAIAKRDIGLKHVSDQKNKINNIFKAFGWKYCLVPDVTGMVTPAIITMIINEAWYALGEDISTRVEIDTAMKLGTNYPFGPFEWGDKIGLYRVKALLTELGRNNPRYTIAPMLKEY